MERCQQCGNPKYICNNDDNDITFSVKDEVCYAKRRQMKHEDDKKKDKNREGVAVSIEAYTLSGTPLDEFRGPYYDLKSEEREKVVESRPVIPRSAPPGATPKKS